MELKAVCTCENTVKNSENPAHTLKKGTVLYDNMQNARYLVGSVLGQGGFGITYIGFDFKLERKVVVKECFPLKAASRAASGKEVLLDCEAKEKVICQFVREGQMLARFRQENIVSVHDVVEQNNTAYLIIDFIEGITLRQYLDKMGKVSVYDALKIMQPIAKALIDVHTNKNHELATMIHRDIKPSNIMLSDKGAVLIDFGCSKYYREFTSNLTGILSINYSPLEMCTNDPLTPAVDVYAFCATIYRMITGVEVKGADARSYIELREKKESVTKPSELGIEIDTDIEKALIYGLALLPENRYKSMQELYKHLYASYEKKQIEDKYEKQMEFERIDEHLKLKVLYEDGGEVEYKAVVAFKFKDTQNEYVVYEDPMAPMDGEGNSELLVSLMREQEGGEVILEDVPDEEWERVQEVIMTLGKSDDKVAMENEPEEYQRKKMSVVGADGSVTEYEVVVAFEFKDTKQEYVIYRDPKEKKDSEGNTHVYATRIERDENGNPSTMGVTDEEFKRVLNVLQELSENKNGIVYDIDGVPII